MIKRSNYSGWFQLVNEPFLSNHIPSFRRVNPKCHSTVQIIYYLVTSFTFLDSFYMYLVFYTYLYISIYVYIKKFVNKRRHFRKPLWSLALKYFFFYLYFVEITFHLDPWTRRYWRLCGNILGFPDFLSETFGNIIM